jgi:hypothetical protein
VYKGGVRHLQGILFRPVSTGRILSEVQEAIHFLQEAAILRVLMKVLHQSAGHLLPHLTAAQAPDQEDLIPRDLLQDLLQGLPQAHLHQEEEEGALLQAGDSLKQ